MTAASRPGSALDGLARLEEERDFLLRSLDDLERERATGELDDDEYAALRDDYTRRAAEVLRAIDAGRSALPTRRPVRWGLVAGVLGGVALVAAIAGVLLASAAGSRLDGTITGDIDRSRRDTVLQGQLAVGRGQFDAAVELMDELLASDPDDVDALVVRGEALLRSGSPVDALEAVDRVLVLDDDHPRATFLKGAVLVQLPAPELQDQGIDLLDRAVELAPQDWQAWLERGTAYDRLRDDPAEAIRSFRRALDLGPPAEVVAVVEQAIAGLRERAG